MVTLSQASNFNRLTIAADKCIFHANAVGNELNLNIEKSFAINGSCKLTIADNFNLKGRIAGEKAEEFNLHGELSILNCCGSVAVKKITINSGAWLRSEKTASRSDSFECFIDVFVVHPKANIALRHGVFNINHAFTNSGLFTGGDLEFKLDCPAENHYVLWASNKLLLGGNALFENKCVLGCSKKLIQNMQEFINHGTIACQDLHYIPVDSGDSCFKNIKLIAVKNFLVEKKEINALFINMSDASIYAANNLIDEAHTEWQNYGTMLSLNKIKLFNLSNLKEPAIKVEELNLEKFLNFIAQTIKGYFTDINLANLLEFSKLKKQKNQLNSAALSPTKSPSKNALASKQINMLVARELLGLVNQLCERDSSFLQQFPYVSVHNGAHVVSAHLNISAGLNNDSNLLAGVISINGQTCNHQETGVCHGLKKIVINSAATTVAGHMETIDIEIINIFLELNSKSRLISSGKIKIVNNKTVVAGLVKAKAIEFKSDDLNLAIAATVIALETAFFVINTAHFSGQVLVNDSADFQIGEGYFTQESVIYGQRAIRIQINSSLKAAGYVAAELLSFSGAGSFIQTLSNKIIAKKLLLANPNTLLAGKTIAYLDLIALCELQLTSEPDSLLITTRSQRGCIKNFVHNGVWRLINISRQLSMYEELSNKLIKANNCLEDIRPELKIMDITAEAAKQHFREFYFEELLKNLIELSGEEFELNRNFFTSAR